MLKWGPLAYIYALKNHEEEEEEEVTLLACLLVGSSLAFLRLLPQQVWERSKVALAKLLNAIFQPFLHGLCLSLPGNFLTLGKNHHTLILSLFFLLAHLEELNVIGFRLHARAHCCTVRRAMQG